MCAKPLADSRLEPALDEVFAALAIGLSFAGGRGVRPLPLSFINIPTKYESDLGLSRPKLGGVCPRFG